MDAYKLLDIPPTATKDEIRSAYRALARRWHPDRFMVGPERDWANNRMAEINAAYRTCLNRLKDARGAVRDEDARLAEVRQMIDDGRFADARRMLMGCSTRCAEWNYLFGLALAAMRETDKAAIYLGVAAHQNPASAVYARALREVRRQQASRLRPLQELIARARMGQTQES